MGGAGGTNTARDARGAADRPSIACCCGTACKHVGVRGKGPPGCTKEPRATALPFGKGIYRIAIVRARPITSITRSCAGCPTGTAQIPAPGRDGGSDPRGCAQTARCVREPQGEPTGKHRIKRKRKKNKKAASLSGDFPHFCSAIGAGNPLLQQQRRRRLAERSQTERRQQAEDLRRTPAALRARDEARGTAGLGALRRAASSPLCAERGFVCGAAGQTKAQSRSSESQRVTRGRRHRRALRPKPR